MENTMQTLIGMFKDKGFKVFKRDESTLEVVIWINSKDYHHLVIVQDAVLWNNPKEEIEYILAKLEYMSKNNIDAM